MACEAEQAALVALQQQVAAIEQEIADTPPPERAAAQKAAQKQLGILHNEEEAAGDALRNCLVPFEFLRITGPQPKDILHINFQTPDFGGTGIPGPRGDWASPIAGGKFPFHQGMQWKQVMDTTDEYDATPVGATGWAAYQDTAGKDTPGLHAFGNDWEFDLVLDPEYLNLVSYGNTALNSDDLSNPDGPNILNDLPQFGIPQLDLENAATFGLLGVEWENGLVPDLFQVEFHDGDRIAVFGRWIVDTGHDDFHTEIHPPLLLASASVYQQQSSGQQFTRALVASRPYLTGQLFANGSSTDQIYNDSSGDDGYFISHLASEFRKANTFRSTQAEAHIKIKELPFVGAHLCELIVAASPLPQGLIPGPLTLTFRFTHRTGCSVQIVPNDATSVRVFIVLNSAAYVAPPLPTRQNLTLSISDLKDLIGLSDPEGLGVDDLEVLNILADPVGAYFLSNGVQFDQYADLPVIDYTRTNLDGAAVNVSGTSVPQDVGITLDDTQPFPVTGWIEVSCQPAVLVRLRSASDSSLALNIESGPLVVGPVDPGQWSAYWEQLLRPTVDGDPVGQSVFWIRNYWQRDQYLNVESGVLQCNVVDPGLSARWTFEPVPGTSAYYIRNVSQPYWYLNIQSGAVTATPIQPDWLTAQWAAEPVN